MSSWRSTERYEDCIFCKRSFTFFWVFLCCVCLGCVCVLGLFCFDFGRHLAFCFSPVLNGWSTTRRFDDRPSLERARHELKKNRTHTAWAQKNCFLPSSKKLSWKRTLHWFLYPSWLTIFLCCAHHDDCGSPIVWSCEWRNKHLTPSSTAGSHDTIVCWMDYISLGAPKNCYVILPNFILHVATKLMGSIGKEPFFPLLSSAELWLPCRHKMLLPTNPTMGVWCQTCWTPDTWFGFHGGHGQRPSQVVATVRLMCFTRKVLDWSSCLPVVRLRRIVSPDFRLHLLVFHIYYYVDCVEYQCTLRLWRLETPMTTVQRTGSALYLPGSRSVTHLDLGVN